MRRPSARCTPNTVTIQHWVRWDKDAAGGRIAVFSPPGPLLSCSVQNAADPGDTPDHAREQAVNFYEVLFHDGDPGARVRDRITWIDGGGAVLIVKGSANQAGHGGTFVVQAEQRPLA